MNAGRRLLSTSTSIKVPLALHGIDGRYATALFSAAAKQSALEAVDGDLVRIRSAVVKDPKLQAFLADPTLGRQAKKDGVAAMLRQGKYSALTANFFQLLAENGRLNETTKIADAFTALMAAHRGDVTVNVTSAKPLDNKQLSQLKTALSKGKIIGSGNVKIVSKTDPSILGGLIVEVGDKSIDLSIASRVVKLNKLLTDSI